MPNKKHHKRLSKKWKRVPGLGPLPPALRPTGRKQITRQATRTMRKVYKPAIHDIRSQERKLQAINEKRQQDNLYYRQWLDTQAEQLSAHAAAADEQLQESQQGIQNSANEAILGLRQQLLDDAGSHAGTVSNAQQASSFNTAAEGTRGAEQIANERMRTSQMLGTNQDQQAAYSASNEANIIASDRKRESDFAGGMKELSEAKRKIQLERAAKTAEEIARRMDQEIAKAGTVMELRGTGKGLKLDKKRLDLDRWIAEQNAAIQRGELKLARADSRRDAQTARAERRQDNRHHQNDRQDARNENQQENQQENRQQSRQIERDIRNGIQVISSNNNLAEAIGQGSQGRNKAVRKLVNRGMEPVMARAAVSLFAFGSLPSNIRKELHRLGLNIPSGWK